MFDKYCSLESWLSTWLCFYPLFSTLVAALVLVWCVKKPTSHQRAWEHVATTFIVVLAVSISSDFAARTFFDKRTGEAGAGVLSTFSQLPRIEGIEQVDSQDDSFLSEDCTAVGRRYLLLGTSLSARQALDLYTQQLQASGWKKQEDQYEDDRVFVRGAHEFLNISYYGGDGRYVWNWRTQTNYLAVKKKYSNFLYVRIEYYVPNR